MVEKPVHHWTTSSAQLVTLFFWKIAGQTSPVGMDKGNEMWSFKMNDLIFWWFCIFPTNIQIVNLRSGVIMVKRVCGNLNLLGASTCHPSNMSLVSLATVFFFFFLIWDNRASREVIHFPKVIFLGSWLELGSWLGLELTQFCPSPQHMIFFFFSRPWLSNW